MISYLTNKKYIKNLKIEDIDLIFLYSNSKISINTNTLIISKKGKILNQNYFNIQDNVDIEVLKYIAFRVYLNFNSLKKFVATIDLYGKRKEEVKKIFNDEINLVKNNIINLNYENLIKMLDNTQYINYPFFLQAIEYYKGKKFIKIYPEAIKTIFNIFGTLYKGYIYHHIKILPKYYESILDINQFYFALDYIKNIGISTDDLDDGYDLKENSIKIIFQFFNEKIEKTIKKYNSIDNITNDIIYLNELKRFS